MSLITTYQHHSLAFLNASSNIVSYTPKPFSKIFKSPKNLSQYWCPLNLGVRSCRSWVKRSYWELWPADAQLLRKTTCRERVLLSCCCKTYLSIISLAIVCDARTVPQNITVSYRSSVPTCQWNLLESRALRWHTLARKRQHPDQLRALLKHGAPA